jgi:hypothetical protein
VCKQWSYRFISSFFFLQEQEVLVSQSNQILTAIIHGMRQSEPSNHVRLAATTALLNSLEFTRANFDRSVGITVTISYFVCD